MKPGCCEPGPIQNVFYKEFKSLNKKHNSNIGGFLQKLITQGPSEYCCILAIFFLRKTNIRNSKWAKVVA